MRLLFAPLALVSAVALANDGSGSLGVGGTVRPSRSPHLSVRLVEETIRVKLPEGRVRVEFTFRNEGPATKVTMIFPENGYRAAEMPGYRSGKKSQFGYFRTWVDGKQAVATLRPQKADDGGEGLAYANWWTKEVSFGRGQTRHVTNEYQGGFDFGPPWTSMRGFSYVLQTGKSWKGGKIGKTTAVVDARDVYRNSPVELFPKGWKGWKGYYTWVQTNYVPDENLWVRWYDGYLRFKVNDVSAEKLLELEQAPDSKVMPVRKGDEIFIPVRMAAKALGASFLEGPMRLENHIKKIEIGQVPETFIDHGRTMVPLRFVAHALGGRYAWYEDGLHIVMPPKPSGSAE
jgi:hypothetical protein